MKRATTLLLGAVLSATFILSSCEKMMEVESDRQAFEPELNAKTDSVFYAFGIAQAMQQLADQYFYQGEMRGELVAPTEYTDSALTQLRNFSAGLSNKYDSAYAYYRVINNCNYYIAHRDTTLRTGATDVTRNEYVAVKTFRAWAYLQLARNYGRVPFFTEPLTSISQIDDNSFPEYDLQQIADALCADLAQYAGTPQPNYGAPGAASGYNTKLIFIPVDVILGELYLETGRYQEAADSYFNYLQTTKTEMPTEEASFRMRENTMSFPTDMDTRYTNLTNNTYMNAFSRAVAFIPMATNRLRGTTSNIPYSFGYDYYSITESWMDNIQLVPSEDYDNLVNNLEYYYYRNVVGGLPRQYITSGTYGDMRSITIMRTRTASTSTTPTASDDEDTKTRWIQKNTSPRVILYRQTTVYLHLCEALNRLGLSDAAFAFLKEGITTNLTLPTTTWLSDEGKQYFLNTFLNATNVDVFGTNNNPIHQHGHGATNDGNYPGSSPYQFNSEIARKFGQLVALDNKEVLYPGLAARVSAGTTTKADTIMAMEELLCDEEAMEFCFEGTRWYDLMRFARHKNRAGLPGNAWLADKVKSNNPVVSLLIEDNWYLPFKK